MYSTNAHQYLAYALNVTNIHLRPGTTLLAPKLPLITEIPNTPTTSKPKTSLAQMVHPTNITSSTQTQVVVEPPFPQKLIQSKPAQIEE